jgi:quercetin dioxygenase-like cupin family protein
MSESGVDREEGRGDWQPLRREGTTGVEVRVLLRRPPVVIANLRFASAGAIDEHAAPFEVDVVCLSGEGFVSVGADVRRFSSGDTIAWPAGVPHRLWTEGMPMETLMVEHHDA